MYYILTAVIALLLGVIAGYFVRKLLAEARISSAETAAQKIVEEAKQEAKAIQREKFLEAKEEAHRLRNEIERESRERRQRTAAYRAASFTKRRLAGSENQLHGEKRRRAEKERRRKPPY